MCWVCGQSSELGFAADVPTRTGASINQALAAVPSGIDPTTEQGVADTIPGNTTSTARISVGGSVTGVINSATDQDWYGVNLMLGQSYTIWLFGQAGVASALPNPQLYVYSSTGTQLAVNDNGYSEGGNSRLVFTPSASGLYFLGADNSGTETGGYQLRIGLGLAPPPPATTDVAIATDRFTDAELYSRFECMMTNITVRFNETPSAARIVTYQFETAMPTDAPSWSTGYTWSGTTAAEQTAIRDVLAEYETYINVDFVEVTGQADADLNFAHANLEANIGGRGGWRYAGGGTSFDGTALFNTNRDLSLANNRELIVHELGHAMGLRHPGNYSLIPGNEPAPPYLPTAEDNHQYSIMSYNINPTTNARASRLMVYDVAALQYRWGANDQISTGNNDVYNISATSPLRVIWDADGDFDAIFSQFTTYNSTIDLRGGAFSSIGAENNVVIAFGAHIERASGSNGNDTIIGNSTHNILSGGRGNDTLTGGLGYDTFDYQGGHDVVTDFDIRATDEDIHLQFSGAPTNISSVRSMGVQVGLNTVLNFSSGNSLTLNNVNLNELTAYHFRSNGSSFVNFLNGTRDGDNLQGNIEANIIFGDEGRDVIDGRGGDDTIDGYYDDDTIYYYASDRPQNISGGLGFDTLLVTGVTSAPISFNLVAQGFEQARMELVDTGNNTWSTISQVFNTSWQMLTSNHVNDDASRRFTTYDRANAQTWNFSEEDYNTAGARYELRTYYDDNTRRTTGYDVNNAQTYATYEEDYNVAGQRTALRTYYDDGTRRTTGYDTTGQTWLTYEEDYNVAGQRVALRTYNDDGTRRATQWDPANGATWSLIEEYYNSADVRTRQITDYDIPNVRLARLDTVWDVGNTQAWLQQTTQTNNVGTVVRIYGLMDNGSAFG